MPCRLLRIHPAIQITARQRRLLVIMGTAPQVLSPRTHMAAYTEEEELHSAMHPRRTHHTGTTCDKTAWAMLTIIIRINMIVT